MHINSGALHLGRWSKLFGKALGQILRVNTVLPEPNLYLRSYKTNEVEAQFLAFGILLYSTCFPHLWDNLSRLVTLAHHIQYISVVQNGRWSEKFWNTWNRETVSLIAALTLSVALSGSWKSSAPREASAKLLLIEGHCTLLCHFSYRAMRYHCPQYPQRISPVVWAGPRMENWCPQPCPEHTG